MKITTPILSLIILSLCFYSCNRQYPHSIQTAALLTYTCPDSALILLEQLKNSISQESQSTQMYYWLLTIKAQDKAYLTHTSDSLVTEVLHYYENKWDKKHLPEAYYYAGRVYSDLGDAPQALNYFIEATKVINKDTDPKLASLIYSQIGTLYLYQDVYDKALSVFNKAYQYSVLTKDSVSMVYHLRDFGRTFSTLNQEDSALYYYKEAGKLAEKIRNENLSKMVNGELSGYYTELGMHKEAYKSIQIATQTVDPIDSAPLYSSMARYYFHTNQLDSATYYYSQLITTDSYLHKQVGFEGLSNIARIKGEYKKALSYMDKSVTYTDSLQSITQTEAVHKINALYNYQLREDENNRLRTQAQHQKVYITISIVTIIMMVTSFFAYRQTHKRKEENKIAQLNKLKKIQDEKYKQSQAYIEENRKYIEQLTQKLQEAQKFKSQLEQELLIAQKCAIEKSNELIEAQQKLAERAVRVLKFSEIYNKFHDSHSKLSTEDWNTLIYSIDETYSQFTQRLKEIYPIKEIELQICLLIKIEIPLGQISQIIVRSKQAVTSIRNRLYKKFFKEEGSPEEWDKFIREF